MSFYRGRRLRRNAVIRRMVRETVLQAQDLIYPIFVEEGRRGKAPIAAMPGIHQYGLDALQEVVEEMQACGVCACILFGIPEHKDHAGSSASDPHGIVQEAIRTLKRLDPQLYVIADVCMCEYTDHGHCGILDAHGEVMNDETLTHLCRIALSYAHAGADMVAPSDMMDGHIQALRSALDEAGYVSLPIMGYSAKYASAYYGPFREAAHSAPAFGDRRAYQMDIGNRREAMREIAADIAEGADIIMVKPALAYLDVIHEASQRFDQPLCAYNVSGEYSMLRLAVDHGIVSEAIIMESLLAIKRAGAKLIITYFALEAARQLQEQRC